MAKARPRMEIKPARVKCYKCNNGKNWVCKSCYEQLFDEHDSAKIIIKVIIERNRALEKQLEELRQEIDNFGKCKYPKEYYYKGG